MRRGQGSFIQTPCVYGMVVLELCALKNMHFYLIINYIFTYIIIMGIFHCLNVECDVQSLSWVLQVLNKNKILNYHIGSWPSKLLNDIVVI